MQKYFGIRSIGFVENKILEPGRYDWDKVVSKIKVDPRFSRHLDGIEEYSHLYIIYRLHRERRRAPKIHPRGRADLPLVGVFATRSGLHPNRLGLTLVELLSRKGDTLEVRGLDAINGTPIIDIKPYDNHYDRARAVKIPLWLQKLIKESG